MSRTGPQLEFQFTRLAEIRGAILTVAIKSVCSRWSGAVLNLALAGKPCGWTWSLAWSVAWVKARQPRCYQNLIILILFLVNIPLVWGLFLSFVMSHYLSQSIFPRNRKHGFISCLFSYFSGLLFYGVFGRIVQLCNCTECLFWT